MSKAIQGRLTKELKNLVDKPICESTVVLENEDDVRNWIVVMRGPVDSVYQEGYFKLKFSFPDNYPFKPPDVKFLTTMYHPNIKKDTGEICLDVFTSGWLPTQNTTLILEKIASILGSPSTSSPLEPEIANEFSSDYNTFVKNAKEYITKYASEKI